MRHEGNRLPSSPARFTIVDVEGEGVGREVDDARARELAIAVGVMAMELTMQSLVTMIAELPSGAIYVKRARAKWLKEMANQEKRLPGEEGEALIGAAHASFARMFSAKA